MNRAQSVKTSANLLKRAAQTHSGPAFSYSIMPESPMKPEKLN
jgi:hypothetical protein